MFEYLQQIGMQVDEYLAKLISLEMFAPGLVTTEKMHDDCFIEGLIYPIR